MKSQTEEQRFLEEYDPNTYTPMAVTVDLVVFGVTRSASDNYRKLDSQKLNILLVQRNEFPFKDSYALPGGFVRPDETLEQAAQRVLRAKTGLDELYLEQLYTFGAVERDPRMRVISCAYLSLIDTEQVQIVDAQWRSVDDVDTLPLAFDHNQIIAEARTRLKNKINYTDIVFHMMPETFTISQLQEVYEIILGTKLLPAAFRRTIAEQIVETDEFAKAAGHRPSRLFRKR
ncbi:MAG: NUDIX hydrolase [Ruminococcus sp.]